MRMRMRTVASIRWCRRLRRRLRGIVRRDSYNKFIADASVLRKGGDSIQHKEPPSGWNGGGC